MVDSEWAKNMETAQNTLQRSWSLFHGGALEIHREPLSLLETTTVYDTCNEQRNTKRERFEIRGCRNSGYKQRACVASRLRGMCSFRWVMGIRQGVCWRPVFREGNQKMKVAYPFPGTHRLDQLRLCH